MHRGIGASGDETMLRMTIDSKAMRKIATEEAFYAAIEVVEIGVANLSVFFDSRALFALP